MCVCGLRSAHRGTRGAPAPVRPCAFFRCRCPTGEEPHTTDNHKGERYKDKLRITSCKFHHTARPGTRRTNGMKQSTPAVTEENATAKSVAADSVPAYGAKRDSQQRDSQHARRFWMCAVCRMPRNHASVDVCCKCHAVRGSERKARGETLAEAVVASVLSKY